MALQKVLKKKVADICSTSYYGATALRVSDRSLGLRKRSFCSLAARLLVSAVAFAAFSFGQSGLKVQYRTHDTDSPDNQIYALYQIVNTGSAAVPLNALTMRYWYTKDGAQLDVFSCDFAQMGLANVTGRFVTLPNPVPLADSYVEVGFTPAAGMLGAGQSSGEIQTRVHRADFTNFFQSNDYSIDPKQNFVYEDWPKITLYLNGVLVWGIEPVSTGPDTQPPSVPGGLTATAITSNSVSLSWTPSTDNVGVAGYDILDGTTLVGSSSGVSFIAAGLIPSTTHAFSVRARDAAGNASAASAALTVTTGAAPPPDSQAPTMPSGLTVTGTTSSSVSLSWTASTDNVAVSSYDILNGTSMVGTSTTPGFTVSNLTASTTYIFSVRARDLAGNISAASAPVTATTGSAASLKVQYRPNDIEDLDNQVYAQYIVVNAGAAAVPLSTLTLRYWYTIDGVQPQSFNCDFATVGCANLTSKFVPLSTPKPTADYYVEVGFTAAAGNLAGGGNSGEIQTRIHKNDWSLYHQNNDYSFNPLFRGHYTDWNRVTLYLNGVLVWGVEP